MHEEDFYTFSTRMESYYYKANKDDLFREQDEELKRERFRQIKAEINWFPRLYLFKQYH